MSLPADGDPKQATAIQALRRFYEARVAASHTYDPPSWALGSLSRSRYEEFRSSQEEPTEWPSTTLIRNAFGNFKSAIAAAFCEPELEITSRRLTAIGFRYTKDEGTRALKAWVDHVDEQDGPRAPLRHDAYEIWARKQRSLPSGPAVRCPSGSVLIREFKTWGGALAAIGQAGRTPYLAAVREQLEDELARDFDFSKAPKRRQGRNPHMPAEKRLLERKDDLLDWLKWVASQLSNEKRKALRAKDYDEIVESVARVSAARGEPLKPPPSEAFRKCDLIGGWREARRLTGIDKDPSPDPTPHTTRPYSDEELIRWILRAIEQHGPGLTRAEYDRWRRDELQKAEGAGSKGADRPKASELRIPSTILIRQRLSDQGSFQDAVGVALERARELSTTSDDGDATSQDEEIEADPEGSADG